MKQKLIILNPKLTEAIETVCDAALKIGGLQMFDSVLIIKIATAQEEIIPEDLNKQVSQQQEPSKPV